MIQARLRPRWTSLICWGSVLLNIVLVTILIVRAEQFFMPSFPPSPEKVLERIGGSLEGRDREVFDAVTAKRLPEIKATAARAKEAFKSLQAEIARDPFDADRLEAAHKAMGQVRTDMDAVIYDTLKTVIRDLSPDGRKRLSEFPKRP